jgi:hypothetical protein
MDVNIQNSLGESPLHISVFRGYHQIVSILLQHGANPSLRSNDNRSVFDYAFQFEDQSIKALLDLHSPVSQTLDSNDFLLSATSVFDNFSNDSPLRQKCLTDRNSREGRGQGVVVEETSVLDESVIFFNKTTRLFGCSSFLDERLKTKNNFFKEELLDFLERNKLRHYFRILVANGFDHLDGLLIQMKTQKPLNHFNFNEIGIFKPGDRSRLIVALENASLDLKFTGIFNSTEEMLEEIGLGIYFLELKRHGMEKISFLLENAFNSSVFNEEELKSKLLMKKYGHRLRFLSVIQYCSTRKSSSCTIL